MRKRWVIILTAGVVLVLLGVFFISLPSNGRFAKYVCSPVPQSVRIVNFESNDWLSANPEPVCYLAFTATADDIAIVVQQGGFKLASTNAYFPVPPGPPGWVTADQLGPNGRVYTRSHSPSRGRLPIGRNRRWSEFLWIDDTGTNAYFLLWGV